MPGVAEMDEIFDKKQKKKKQKPEEDAAAVDEEPKQKKKKRKPEAAADAEDEEIGEPKQNKKKKSSPKSENDSEQNPLAVSNFKIPDPVRAALKEKGIETLFPIQAQTFDIVLGGDDLVARARTGQGKTLAFVLPIVASLTKAGLVQRKTYGRAPSVLVLAPTRELAKQVHADFECYGGVAGLSTVCVYGGSPYNPQQSAMKRGVDIVVGTPGRIKDFMDRGDLNLKTLRFRVLDEADEMLNMGFVEAVEEILGAVEDTSTVQTLLFSATLPHWVKDIAQRFFKPGKKTVDLVGDDKMKASHSVKHLLLPCAFASRSQIIADVIKVYGIGGRVIVFTETKNDASDLAGVLGTHIAKALHGDIPQAQREITLSKFRSGKFNVLVATDVAARGLDINDVQLIIQCEPPRDVETYIHRSGRTGRAGNTGVAVMLYDRKKEYMIPMIESKAGFKFERVSAPQPETIAKESSSIASQGVNSVSNGVIPLYKDAAQELVNSSGLSPLELLAKALAKISGYTEVKRRSLQTSHDDATTLLFQASNPIYSPGYVYNALRSFLPDEYTAGIRRMNLTVDGKGAVFDVPSENVEEFLKGSDSQNSITIAESLPALTPKPERDNGRDNNNRFNTRGRYSGQRGRHGSFRGRNNGGRGWSG